MLYRAYRYSRWDGSQALPDLDADELMDQLSDELLKQGDVMRALRELLRQGMQNRQGQRMTGLREMMEQLKEQRRRQLQNYNMDSVVDDLKERLENILRTEREGIDRKLEQAKEQVGQASEADRPPQENLQKLLEQRAQRNRQKLDDLPEGLGGQIQGLMEYDFMDPQAQQMFQELLDMLKQQMAQNMAQQMQQQAQGMSPEAMSAMLRHPWPGNVRELENVVERAMTLTAGEQVGPEAMLLEASPAPAPASLLAQASRRPTIEELTSDYVTLVLREAGGDKAKAAEILGISKRTLYRWERQLEGSDSVSSAETP